MTPRYKLRTLLILLAVLPPLLWIGWTKYEAWRAERESRRLSRQSANGSTNWFAKEYFGKRHSTVHRQQTPLKLNWQGDGNNAALGARNNPTPTRFACAAGLKTPRKPAHGVNSGTTILNRRCLMSRAWFALAVAGVLGLFYVAAGLQDGPAGLTFGQEVVVQPLFKKPAPTPSLQFRYIGSNGNSDIYRAKITGGWLICANENPPRNGGLSVAFVPDPEHKWDGNSLP